MKTYNKAELQIVRMNNDIVTASIGIGNTQVTDAGQVQAPERRRRSIWDWSLNENENSRAPRHLMGSFCIMSYPEKSRHI